MDGFLARGARFSAVLIDRDTTHRWFVDGPAASHAFLDRLAEARPVPHRGLTPDDTAALPDDGRCFWLAAGGHAEAGWSDRDHVTFIHGVAS